MHRTNPFWAFTRPRSKRQRIKSFLNPASPDARRQALLWKTEAIPVLQRSLLNTDPLAASLDAWAFVLQMSKYMAQPLMQQRFGESYPIVTQTLQKMETQIEQLIQRAAPKANMANVKQQVSSWAEAHPIEVGLSGRTSLDAEMIRRTEQSELGTRASVKALAESIGDITARLDSYNAYLPKQARWQAELLVSDQLHDPQVAAAMSNLGTVSTALGKAAGNLEHLPELAGQARRAVVADLEGQRLATQAFVRKERLETLDALKHERIATISDIRKERLAATEDLRGERKAVVDALQNQEKTVMKDLDTAREKGLKDLDTRSRGLIDHFFVRAIEVALLTLILLAVAAWILLQRFRPRRREDRGETSYKQAA